MLVARPYIVLQMAASIDGRISFCPNLTMFDSHPAAKLLPGGDELWARVAAAIEAQHHPRATIMGSGTVERNGAKLRELPRFTGDPKPLYQHFLPEAVVARTQHWAVLVDGRGRCRSGYKGTENPGSHILHLVSHSAPAEYLAFLREQQIPYLISGMDHVDLRDAMHELRRALGVETARLYGGGTLNGAMLRARLIDEVHLIVWPVLIGGDATPTLTDCADLTPGELPARLQLISAQPQPDGHLWLHYRAASESNGIQPS